MAIEHNRAMTFTYGEPREIAPGIARLVANNPSPLTFHGTNTYLLGTNTVAVIDPGPDDPEHIDAIVRAIGGRPVSQIILTHAHGDHSDGIPRLQAALNVPFAGYGYVPKVQTGKSRVAPDGREVGVQSVTPDIVLRDGSIIEGDGWRLEAIFTPGHAPDHLCFALTGTGIVFSGDHVMGWNTSVVAPPEGSMKDYLASLERMRGRGDTLYLPGHGGRLAEPERTVKGYLIHRRMREDAILGAIREQPRSIKEIVEIIYPAIDPKLVRAAAFSVQAHVEHLAEKRQIDFDGPLTADLRLFPV